MHYGNTELHNVAEIAARPDGGVRLQRVPEAVRRGLGEHGQERMLDPAGMEIRFVAGKGRAAVTLHSLGGPLEVDLFFGDLQASRHRTIGQSPEAVEVELPPWLPDLPREALGRTAFSPRVCRLLLCGGTVCLHGVDGDVRPPTEDEVPRLRYLAYGTSITQGAGAAPRHLCFASETARRLGADLVNLGSASSAFCEPAMADYLASRRDWHIATVEPTANMQRFALDEFRRRVAYLIDRLAGADRRRPVGCITLMALAADMGPAHVGRDGGGSPDGYRRALREAAESLGRPNVHVVEGTELLGDLADLTTSLVHPSVHGHVRIAERLAPRLAAWLEGSATRGSARGSARRGEERSGSPSRPGRR